MAKDTNKTDGNIRVLYINNDGGGFANYVDVKPGVTVEDFFGERFSKEESLGYMIRVNRQPVAQDYVLQPDDRVTVTPMKVAGSRG
jgi:hypothetical protein